MKDFPLFTDHDLVAPRFFASIFRNHLVLVNLKYGGIIQDKIHNFNDRASHDSAGTRRPWNADTLTRVAN